MPEKIEHVPNTQEQVATNRQLLGILAMQAGGFSALKEKLPPVVVSALNKAQSLANLAVEATPEILAKLHAFRATFTTKDVNVNPNHIHEEPMSDL